MKNLTLAIDDDLLDKTRAYAESHGTTVNAMVREHFTNVVSQEARREEARRGLIELMRTSTGRLGPDYNWNREELYESRMLPGHQRSDLRGRNED